MSIVDLFYDNKMKRTAGVKEFVRNTLAVVGGLSLAQKWAPVLMSLYMNAVSSTGAPPTQQQVQQVQQEIQAEAQQEHKPEEWEARNQKIHDDAYQKQLETKKTMQGDYQNNRMNEQKEPDDYSGGYPPQQRDPMQGD